MKCIKNIAIFLITGILFVGGSSFDKPVSQPDAQEYILKAAFIYHFADYIDWASQNDGDDFTIAVLGESAIVNPLNEIAKDKKIKNKKILIKTYKNIDDINTCQILFISTNYNVDIATIASKIGTKPVLIITEQEGACEKGADINFIISDSKLKFEINLKAALKAGLKVSSQLLQHAILINT